MKEKMSRRQALKALGLTVGAATIGLEGLSRVSRNVIEY